MVNTYRLIPRIKSRGLVIFALIAVSLILLIEGQLKAQDLDQLLDQRNVMLERLHLTPDQAEKIEPVLSDSLENKLSVLEKYGFGEGQKPKLSLRKKFGLAKEMQKVQKATEKTLASFLSSDQMKIYKAIQKENREKMKARLK